MIENPPKKGYSFIFQNLDETSRKFEFFSQTNYFTHLGYPKEV